MFTIPLQQMLALAENEQRTHSDHEGGTPCRSIEPQVANAAAGIMMMPLVSFDAVREPVPAKAPLGQRVLALWNSLFGSRGLTHS